VEPFGAGFGGFDRESLQAVRQEKFAVMFGFF
jgi:hypothetical protein